MPSDVTDWRPMIEAQARHGDRIWAQTEEGERLCECYRFDNHMVWRDSETHLVYHPTQWKPVLSTGQ